MYNSIGIIVKRVPVRITVNNISHLAVSETILVGFQLQGRDEQLTRLAAVHESSRDGLGGQDGIPRRQYRQMARQIYMYHVHFFC